jgi:hypothetical protein
MTDTGPGGEPATNRIRVTRDDPGLRPNRRVNCADGPWAGLLRTGIECGPGAVIGTGPYDHSRPSGRSCSAATYR